MFSIAAFLVGDNDSELSSDLGLSSSMSLDFRLFPAILLVQPDFLVRVVMMRGLRAGIYVPSVRHLPSHLKRVETNKA